MQLTAAEPSAADPNTLTPSVRSSNVTSPSRYKRTPLITTTRIISAPSMPAPAGRQDAGRGSGSAPPVVGDRERGSQVIVLHDSAPHVVDHRAGLTPRAWSAKIKAT